MIAAKNTLRLASLAFVLGVQGCGASSEDSETTTPGEHSPAAPPGNNNPGAPTDNEPSGAADSPEPDSNADPGNDEVTLPS